MKTPRADFKTVQGLDSGPLSRHIQPYIAHVHEQGYKPRTIRYHLQLMANFNRWLIRTGRGLRDLNETAIEAFLRPLIGRRTWQAGERRALLRMLCILREARVTPQAKPAQLTPSQALAVQYRQYLAEERGCSDWTVGNYSRHIDRFLTQLFGAGPVRFERLRAQHVIAFVQQEAGRNGRGYILQVVTGLRSFLRFLRYRGDISTDLAAAVPPVANWQKTDLPKHLPADAVQAVLDGCDQTTAVGRRDYAILLLLARLGFGAARWSHCNWRTSTGQQPTHHSLEEGEWLGTLAAAQGCRQSDLTLSPDGPPSLFLPKRLRPHGCALSACRGLLSHLGFDQESDPKSRCRVGAERSACFSPQPGNGDAPARGVFG